MAKNRDHYFKVKPGDDARLFEGVSVEGEGFVARLRRLSHDREPYAFLVKPVRRPLTIEDIADVMHWRNRETRLLFAEVRSYQIIQSALEFRAELARLGERGNKRATNKLVILDEMCATLSGETPLDEVFVMPTLLDDYLDSVAGERFAKKGREQRVLQLVRTGTDDDPTPVGGPYRGADSTPRQAQSQKSGSESESYSASSSGSKKERTSAAAHAIDATLRQQPGSAPWSWEKHLFLCDQVRKWRAKQPDDGDRTRYEIAFAAEFGFAAEIFERAQEHFSHGPDSAPVPQPCLDGHHVPDPVTGRCKYCNGHIDDAEAE